MKNADEICTQLGCSDGSRCAHHSHEIERRTDMAVELKESAKLLRMLSRTVWTIVGYSTLLTFIFGWAGAVVYGVVKDVTELKIHQAITEERMEVGNRQLDRLSNSLDEFSRARKRPPNTTGFNANGEY